MGLVARVSELDGGCVRVRWRGQRLDLREPGQRGVGPDHPLQQRKTVADARRKEFLSNAELAHALLDPVAHGVGLPNLGPLGRVG